MFATNRLDTDALVGKELPSVRRGSAADHAYKNLRERIVLFDLPPDEVLSRAQLSEELGVSLMPLREALQRLEKEGLVTIIPQSKTYVNRIDSRKLESAHFLRMSLESEVVRRLTIAHSTEHMQRLCDTVGQQRNLIDLPEKANDFHALDELFHYQMFEAVGQPELHAMLASQLANLARLRRLELPNKGKMEGVVQAHKAIIAGIRNGDVDEALSCLRADISASISKVTKLKAQYPKYFF